MQVNTMLARIRAEYLEMPGLRLTLEQAQRLCGVDRALCQTVLAALVDAKFLWRNANGAYARLTDGEIPPLQPAKIDFGAVTHVGATSWPQPAETR